MNKKVLKGAIFLGAASLISRILGIVRDYVFSDTFGALMGQGIMDLDAYFAAFRIPDLLFNLLIYGTLSAAFVPIFSGYLQKKENEKAWYFANNTLNILTISLLLISGIFYIFAPQIVSIIFPGFEASKQELTATLTRIMLVSPVLFGLSSYAQSIQNSFKTFFFYSLAPIFYNLSIIAAAILWGKEHGVYALTYGVIIGAGLHFLVQTPMLFKLGYRYKAVFNTKMDDIREMFKLVIPRILGLSIMQFNLLFDNFIASVLFTGALAILNYSVNLNSLPLGVVGISFAIASFSTLSEYANNKDFEGLKYELSKNIKAILALVIPASIGLIVLRNEIVGLILSGASFTLEDKILTANTMALFSAGLFAQSLVPLLAKTFYACKNTKTPLYISLIAFSSNIVLSLILVFVFKWSIYGLAAANTVAGIINVVFLYTQLKKKLGTIKNIKKQTAHFTFASLLMGAILFVFREIWTTQISELDSTFTNFEFLCIAVPISVIFYFAYLKLAKINISFRKSS